MNLDSFSLENLNHPLLPPAIPSELLDNTTNMLDGFEEIQAGMVRVMSNMPDSDKLRLFLEALKAPDFVRHRKHFHKMLAAAANRPDKEIQSLSDQQKALLCLRRLPQLPARWLCIMLTINHANTYAPIVEQLFPQFDTDLATALQLFESERHRVPDPLWYLAVHTRNHTTTGQKLIEANIRRRLLDQKRVLPFSVGDLPDLCPLEDYLLAHCATEPAATKPPSRPSRRSTLPGRKTGSCSV